MRLIDRHRRRYHADLASVQEWPPKVDAETVIKNLHQPWPVRSMLKLDRACRSRTQAPQAMRRFTVSMLAVSLALIASSAGWAGNSRVEFRVYDPTGVVRTEVTGSDVVRSSVHAVRVSGTVHLYGGLTKTGASKFQSLTRALARRGARLHRPQSFAVAIDGHVYWSSVGRLQAVPERPSRQQRTRCAGSSARRRAPAREADSLCLAGGNSLARAFRSGPRRPPGR